MQKKDSLILFCRNCRKSFWERELRESKSPLPICNHCKSANMMAYPDEVWMQCKEQIKKGVV